MAVCIWCGQPAADVERESCPLCVDAVDPSCPWCGGTGQYTPPATCGNCGGAAEYVKRFRRECLHAIA